MSTNTTPNAGAVPMRDLGSTGEKVSLLGIGGHHIGLPKVSEGDAVRIVRTAIDSGLNFMDNSWDYNQGRSGKHLGVALQDGYREKAFVMTKIDGRGKKEAAAQIDESLKRLRMDHVDLLQHHEIIRFEDVDHIFGAGGAMEAFFEAKQAGKLRFIGFTGHKDPHIHLYMLEKAREHNFRFDTVQMPLNLMDAHFRSFEKMVLPVLVEEGIGVLGMKSMGDGVLLKSNTVEPVDCLRYALSLPASVVITGVDSLEILEQALDVARNFKPFTQAEREVLLASTAKTAAQGEFELYKTSSHFDSTAKNLKWLGEDSESVVALTGGEAE
jgi:predicted aldo/keto reductase-like oxidoreductase